ncbi:MAG: pitrilysin family protein, partial [bacterium]|nr:pitrilysin family protein [bacterium]
MLKKTRWSRFTGPVVIFLLLVFCLLPPTSAQDLAEFEKRLTRFTLDNGMTFLVLERHEAPVVSFVTHADVGAVNEVRGITGIAHLLEHMAFKGTKKVGTTGHVGEMWALAKLDAAYAALREELDKRVGEEDPERLTLLRERFKKAQEEASKLVVTNEFAEALNREGATSLNAGTSNDATMYMVSLPSNKLELWMSLESDRFMNPVLREFYKELEVVKEERRMRTESSPQGRLVEEFLAVAFKAHPYGDPVIGHMSDLEALSREKVETFFKAYYAPGNLTVAVVGDVDTEEVRRLAGIYFGRLQPGPKPEPIVTKEPPQNGERRVVLREKTQPSLFIGYHMPGVNHQDRPAFDILSDILGYGRTARLYKSLVKEKKMAANIWAS